MIKNIIRMIIVFFAMVPALGANPIVPYFFSEFMIDSTSWALELHSFGYPPISLDSCYLASSTDTAAFKPGLILDDHYLVISDSSLLTPLSINPNEDELTLFTRSNEMLDFLGFNNLQPGQSLNVMGAWSYLDNSPTLGFPNDTLNAMGTIKGTVTDSSGNLLDGIQVYWGYETFPDNYLSLDSLGHFSVRVFATRVYFFIYDENYYAERYSAFVPPESVVTVHLMFEKQSFVAKDRHSVITDYRLSNNYPNPFNSATRFIYSLPVDDYVEVSIYDLKGRRVENLFSGFQEKGEYQLMWDAFTEASGVYIIRMRTSRVILNRKCLLLR